MNISKSIERRNQNDMVRVEVEMIDSGWWNGINFMDALWQQSWEFVQFLYTSDAGGIRPFSYFLSLSVFIGSVEFADGKVLRMSCHNRCLHMAILRKPKTSLNKLRDFFRRWKKRPDGKGLKRFMVNVNQKAAMFLEGIKRQNWESNRK